MFSHFKTKVSFQVKEFQFFLDHGTKQGVPMKALSFFVSIALISQTVFAGGLTVSELARVLSSDKVQNAVGRSVVTGIQIQTTNWNAASTHDLTLQVREAGLGPKGPDSHPCFVKISANDYDGSGIEFNEILVEKVCAMNSPKPIKK